MSNLIDRVRQALEDELNPIGDPLFKLERRPIAVALLEIAEKASIACADWDLQCEDDKSKLYVTSKAIENLESILEEMEKS